MLLRNSALAGFKSGARAGSDSLLPAPLHRGGNAQGYENLITVSWKKCSPSSASVEKSSLSCLSAAKRFARNLGVLVGMAMLARHGRHQGLQPFGRLRIRGAILEQRPQPFRCGIETTVMADLVEVDV